MPGNAKSMIFLPGEEPGGLASGSKRLIDNTLAAAMRMRRDNVPVGDRVATVFPWMRYVREAITTQDQRFILKRANYAETFANPSDKRIKIHELRFMIPGYLRARYTLMTDLQLKIDISGQRGIIDGWMPWFALCTSADHYRFGTLTAYTWHLPVPYFLQRGHPFVMDVELPYNALASSRALFMTLHGWGVKDGEPIALVKQVDANPTVGTTIYPNIAFDDDRDTPLRDCWINAISFGACEYPNFAGEVPGNHFLFRELRVRPQPPDGPIWHQQEYFDIAMLADQIEVGDGIDNTQRPQIVIHRPITPYILEPGDAMNIEVWARTWSGSSNFTVTAMGTQEPRT